MSWAMLAAAVAGAVAGNEKAKEDRYRQKKQMQRSATEAIASPWTRLAVSDPGSKPSSSAPIMQGIMQGVSFGSQFGKGQQSQQAQPEQKTQFDYSDVYNGMVQDPNSRSDYRRSMPPMGGRYA